MSNNQQNPGQQLAAPAATAGFGAGVQVSLAEGGVVPRSVGDVAIIAEAMCKSGATVPVHARDYGVAFGIALMSAAWRMDPFAVANKTYLVNGRVAYEAQLVNAVALSRAPFAHRPVYEHSGKGQTRKCRVSVKLTDGFIIDYETPEIGQIKVQNSPLWKSDPDQQLCYFAIRSMVRRHLPDVLMGVYTADELSQVGTRGIQARAQQGGGSITSRLDDLAASDMEPIDLTPEPVEEKKPRGKKKDQPVEAEPEQPAGADDGLPPYTGPSMADLQALIGQEPQDIDTSNVREVHAYAMGMGAAQGGAPRSSLPNEFEAQGENVVAAWQAGYDQAASE